MKAIRMLGATLVLAVATMIPARANVFVGIGFGPVLAPVPYAYAPPVCDYGFYQFYPYSCAPYGYYDSDWFFGGATQSMGSPETKLAAAIWADGGGMKQGWIEKDCDGMETGCAEKKISCD